MPAPYRRLSAAGRISAAAMVLSIHRRSGHSAGTPPALSRQLVLRPRSSQENVRTSDCNVSPAGRVGNAVSLMLAEAVADCDCDGLRDPLAVTAAVCEADADPVTDAVIEPLAAAVPDVEADPVADAVTVLLAVPVDEIEAPVL